MPDGVRTDASVDGAKITSSECDMGDPIRLRNTVSGEKVDLPRDVFEALVSEYRGER
jgi:hypothetical protein